MPVWKLSHEYILSIYEDTKLFPKEELFCIVNQLRRAAISITSNIVEGISRHNTKEVIQFLYISRGSLHECDYQLFLSKDLGYISQERYNFYLNKFNDIHIQLNAWIKTLKNT